MTRTPTRNIRTEEAIREYVRLVAFEEVDVDPSKGDLRGEGRMEEVHTEEVQAPTVVMLTTVGDTTIAMSPLMYSPAPAVKAGSTP